MDLAIEANRNSALFNTMQQVLDVYNPLVHKARPTVVNQTKQRIRTPASSWGNNLDRWNGSRTARFNLPRIGSLVDASVKVAFRMPGTAPTPAQRAQFGNRGFASPTLTTGTLNNTDSTSNNARGRLDRIYADRLLGFNMIRSYRVSSKSREIFRATGEYLLLRFSQLDDTVKDAIFKSVTPVDLMAASCDDMFYAPGTTYQMSIPLFMFFNESITNAIDVNFAEEVHIDIDFRAPSELFFYGNIGDLSQITPATRVHANIGAANQTASPNTPLDSEAGLICWDQSTTLGSSFTDSAGTRTDVTVRSANRTSGAGGLGSNIYGTVNVGLNAADDDSVDNPIEYSIASAMTQAQQRHIQGLSVPFDQVGFVSTLVGALTNAYVGGRTYYREAAWVHSSTTFAFPDTDNEGNSPTIQLELNCDFIIQDTDAYRALRAEMFPQGSGFTSIVYNTAQETFSNLFADVSPSRNLLDYRSGGTFSDPDESVSGITVGDSTRYVDCEIRANQLAFSTSFMVRKMSDMGGDGTTAASKTVPTYGKSVAGSIIGAHQIYTRCLPVHYFQILSAGRIIYESDGRTQLALTQSAMYNGTGNDWGTVAENGAAVTGNGAAYDQTRTAGRPFNVYTINHGLSASRLENSGCLSLQNLNNPTLRIYFKPEAWAEHQPATSTVSPTSEAVTAAARGVQVDIIHEYFNVVTVNTGNGEITSGMNQ